MPGSKPFRVAAVGDLHCSKTFNQRVSDALASVNELADALALCGDLTDYGTPDEAHVLVKELAVVKIPIVAVLGNHDHEGGHPEEVTRILTRAGIRVLDGDTCELEGVGFAGVKGFAGGFGRGTLGFWGETAIKRFVQEAIDESLKLESALARLKNSRRVVLMHYAPVTSTIVGEPVEIYPFLGCSRLEEPLVRYPVTAVVHGHAHRGTPEGRAAHGEVPVYNVAMPLLLRLYPETLPFRILELEPITEPAAAAPGTAVPPTTRVEGH